MSTHGRYDTGSRDSIFSAERVILVALLRNLTVDSTQAPQAVLGAFGKMQDNHMHSMVVVPKCPLRSPVYQTQNAGGLSESEKGTVP